MKPSASKLGLGVIGNNQNQAGPLGGSRRSR